MSSQKKKPAANPDAQALGRLGGQARARKLSAERRSGIAKLGGEARWSKKDKKKP